MFAETLQEVASLNANLTDYFVSCLLQLHCLAARHGPVAQKAAVLAETGLSCNVACTAVQLTINEFADKSPEERNGLNGVRGMRKSPPPPAPPEASKRAG